MRRQRRSGQRAAAEVYERLGPAVLGYFRSHRMRDPEGLTGDVFVAVTEHLGSFEGDDGALRRWVFTIAHHRRVDEIRRSNRRPEAARPVEDDMAVHVDREPADEELVRALSHLTDDQRDVVALRYVADLPIRAVAELTGRSVGSVKMLAIRGLDALARELGPEPLRSPQHRALSEEVRDVSEVGNDH